jgi:type I restriction enzyme, S subunit
LRFKEFEDSGEWEEKKMDELYKFIRGPFGGSLKKEIFVSDGYAVYEQAHAIYGDFSSFRYFITEEKYTELKRFAVQPNDIIMSCSGTMGKFSIVPEHSIKVVINQALLKLTVKSGYDISFVKATLELPLNQNKLLSQSAGGAIKNVVEVAQIKEIILSIPSLKEQQKISSFLSSTDDLIYAQSQKVEAFKLHKKGLLQGLFPNVNTVNE